MNLTCEICLKNITPPHTKQSQPIEMSPMIDGGAIGVRGKPVVSFSNRIHQQFKSWYDYFCREGIFTTEEEGRTLYYCQRCGQKFLGVIENVNIIHNLFNQRLERSSGGPLDAVSVSSAMELMDVYPGERVEGRSEAIPVIETDVTTPELHLETIGFNVMRLVSSLLRKDDEPYVRRQYKIAQGQLYPIMFVILLELSQTLRRLFQITSKCRVPYLQAVKAYDEYFPGLENYSPDQFINEICTEIKTNHKMLKVHHHALGGVRDLSKHFYMFLHVDEALAIPEKINDLLSLVDKADVYQSFIAQQLSLHPDRANDFDLLPAEYYTALFTRISKYETILEQVSICAGCSIEFCALWTVCPELRRISAYANRQGVTLAEYINKVLVPETKLERKDVHEIIFTSAKNFLMLLYQELLFQQFNMDKLPEKISMIFSFDLEDFNKTICEVNPEPLVLNSALKTIVQANGESALTGSPSRPRRRAATTTNEQIFNVRAFWDENHFSDVSFDDRLRHLSRQKGRSVMFHALLSVSPLLQSYEKKAKKSNISLPFYLARLSGWRQRRSLIMNAILTEGKQNVVKIKDYAVDERKNFKELSTLLHHVTRLKPEAIENLIFSYDERTLNVVYRAPVIVTLELVLCVLLLVSLVYAGYCIYADAMSASEKNDNSSRGTIPRLSSTTTPGHVHPPVHPQTPSPAHLPTHRPTTHAPAHLPTHRPTTHTPTHHSTPFRPILNTSTAHSTTSAHEICNMPAKGTPCSSLAIKAVTIVLESAISFGAKNIQDFLGHCPEQAQFLVPLMYLWFGLYPKLSEQLQMLLQPGKPLVDVIAFLGKHSDCV